MAVSEDLFLAILSMDAYNRGYNQGLGGLGAAGSQIGNATFTAQSNTDAEGPEVTASFYASAYTWNGKTVISYRGTDDPTPLSLVSDFWNGWTLGAGFSPASQAGLARNFYEAVANQPVFAAAPSNVILTGHSLGGGLAGLVSTLRGTEKYPRFAHWLHLTRRLFAVSANRKGSNADARFVEYDNRASQ
jgi:hypothetical protein